MIDYAYSDISHAERRASAARMVLVVAFAVAALPAVVSVLAVVGAKIGALDWWTAYGQMLVGDGVHLSFAFKVAAFSFITTAAGLAATLWAGPVRFYSRAMLNVALSAVSLWALLLVR